MTQISFCPKNLPLPNVDVLGLDNYVAAVNLRGILAGLYVKFSAVAARLICSFEPLLKLVCEDAGLIDSVDPLRRSTKDGVDAAFLRPVLFSSSSASGRNYLR